MILWEGDPTDPTRKPPEMYTLVENFCLGLRRLELFARARSLRRGWLSVLAEGEEAHVPAVQALRASDAQQLSPEQLDGGTNVLGQELSVDCAERWDQDKWESAMRAWLQNGRAVVPMTPGTSISISLSLCFLTCVHVRLNRGRRPTTKVARTRRCRCRCRRPGQW